MIRFFTAMALLVTSCGLAARSVDFTDMPKLTVIGEVNMSIVEQAQVLLNAGSKEKEVVILVNSPGGSVDAGQLFIQSMEQLRLRGIKINCVSGVLAASMGFQILAHCDKIYALPNTLLLFHPVRIYSGEGLTVDMLAYLQQQMVLTETQMNIDLQAKFKFNKEFFRYHYRNETLHSARDLAQHTSVITLVDDVKGFDPLLYTWRQFSIMDLLGGKGAGILYVAPQSVLDMFKK